MLRTHCISEGREVKRFDRKMGREAGKSGFKEAKVRSLRWLTGSHSEKNIKLHIGRGVTFS